jgi:hypothetical protein
MSEPTEGSVGHDQTKTADIQCVCWVQTLIGGGDYEITDRNDLANGRV